MTAGAQMDQRAALAAAGATAAMFLELDAADLASVERCVPYHALSLALLIAETDPEYSERWLQAGTDWMARGAVLHEALLFVLTPEPSFVQGSV